MTADDQFLVKAAEAARAGHHIFPQMAACEAALESGWGRSQLAVEANNLFGQKQDWWHPEGTGTLSLPTEEFLGGKWVEVTAEWVRFANWAECFAGRMHLLELLSVEYPSYAEALHAETPEEFVELVSRRWSTDPQRAAKVIEIYNAHRGAFPLEA